MTDELYGILKECAGLRGVGQLYHRTLHEFDWFVSHVMHREFEKGETWYPVEVPLSMWDDWHKRKCGYDLVEWAKQFKEYCEFVYCDG